MATVERRSAHYAAEAPEAESRILAAVSELAGALTESDVAQVLVEHAAEVTAARGVAVVLPMPGREVGVVLASTGYDCDTMAPGARLPYSSGLPVTVALRTGQPQTIGDIGGIPGWVVLVLGPAEAPLGALLLSLQPDSRWTAEEAAFTRALARTGSAALSRARSRGAAVRAATALAGSLRPQPVPPVPHMDMAVRVLPLDATLGIGGDVVEVASDGRGGWWLVVADACGSGADAAPRAGAVRTAVRALAPHVHSPADLLAELDRLLSADTASDVFVTAGALHLRADAGVIAVRSASAGHPLPLVRTREGTLRTIGTPGFLLGVEAEVTRTEGADVIRPGELLVLHTDGLTDVPHTPADAWPLRGAVTAADPDAAADATADDILGRVLAGQVQGDDVALVVVRPAAVSRG